MHESIIDMFLTGITIILVIIASTIIELALYGSRLIIWLAVLEIAAQCKFVFVFCFASLLSLPEFFSILFLLFALEYS